MATSTFDAVVIGGGHHGLVAAAELADAGWSVVVLEARDKVGGAVASREVEGFVLDEFSACHPLAKASPVIRALQLEDFGLQWADAARPLVHLSATDRPAAVIEPTPEQTAERLAVEHPADGPAWLEMVEQYRAIREPLLDALLTSWPPVGAAARLARRVGLAGLPDLARFLLLPVTRMGEEAFQGPAARNLLAGNAMHSDVSPTAPVSGMFGWLMSMLAQDSGFPSPVGGSRALAQALERRAQAAGAEIRTGERVTALSAGGRGVDVSTAGGLTTRAGRAVICDTSAETLYRELLRPDDLPAGVLKRMDQFQWDLPTVKLNYRLSSPVPWTDPTARGAGVVHLGHDHRSLAVWSAQLEAGQLPAEPFCLVGQMTTIDPSRSPQGTETLWLYTHLPRGCTNPGVAADIAERAERLLDGHAPGWRDLVLDRWVQGPQELQASNANLGLGAVGGGTQQLFQQAIWRPFTSLGGPRTVVPKVYLGSAAIHPGGGVHGGCGHLAAQAALADNGLVGKGRAGLLRRANRRLAAR